MSDDKTAEATYTAEHIRGLVAEATGFPGVGFLMKECCLQTAGSIEKYLLNALEGANTTQSEPPTCTWIGSETTGCYDAECGLAWCLGSTPTNDGINYCPKCGRKIKEENG